MSFAYKLIDLTHTLTESAPGWNEWCTFRMHLTLDYSDCAGDVKFKGHKITTETGMGTHMDAPAHCFPGATTIDQITLESLVVPCVVIDISARADENYRVTVTDIELFEKAHGIIPSGSLVVIRTGWDQYWFDAEQYRNDYQFPSVALETAQLLLSRGIVGLGVDTFSADRPVDKFVVHGAVLGAGKYLIENIAHVDQLPPMGSFVGVFPVKIGGATESFVRLVGMVPY